MTTEENKPQNLMEGLQSEINRAKEVLSFYEEIPQGAFGAMYIKQTISRGEKAMCSGDIIEMIAAYKELKEVE